MTPSERAVMVAGAELRRSLGEAIDAPAWERRDMQSSVLEAVRRYDEIVKSEGYLPDK